MSIATDLEAEVRNFAWSSWGNIPNARVLPTPEDLTYGNTAERLEVCVLYADIHGSTKMVDELSDTLAAEYYKAFLHCAGSLVRRNEGHIQAYDGDRVMAIYLGDGKCDQAVSTALELTYAVRSIINPAFYSVYNRFHRPLQHTVGTDVGTVLAAKTGVRNANDIVWVGGAANYAAKLNSFAGLDITYPIRVTEAVFNCLSERQLYADGTMMWEGKFSGAGRDHYRTAWGRVLP